MEIGWHAVELVPGPIGMAASAAEQGYKCAKNGLGGDGCTMMDLAGTAAGMIPGSKLATELVATGARKVVVQGTFRTMKRSMPHYLGRAKDARLFGDFTRMRTTQILQGADRLNTGLGAFNLAYDTGGFAGDIYDYYS